MPVLIYKGIIMETLKMLETFIAFGKGNEIMRTADRHLKDVCLLSFFYLDQPELTHPDHWEIHPDGDELLLVTEGALDVEIVLRAGDMEAGVPRHPAVKKVTVSGGESLIVKKGHWHRVILREETNLVVAGVRGNSRLAPVL
jgi:mannose-6-phosphate isomerase-like protein (cupin superfamily)